MNVLIVTGIFPPDSGGPASYVPKLATALCQRGHGVDVVTLSDGLDQDDKAWPFPVHRIRRQLFWLWRLVLTTWTIWRLSRGKDIVYVNGLSSEAALGAWFARRPAVHKIVGDYAWERAQGRNWFPGTLDEYQLAPKSLRLRLLDAIRTRPLHAPVLLLCRVITFAGSLPDGEFPQRRFASFTMRSTAELWQAPRPRRRRLGAMSSPSSLSVAWCPGKVSRH